MEDYRIRIRIFVFIIISVLTVLFGRLVQLQLIERETYSTEASSNAVRDNRILPARGVIYDRNDILMVDNEPMYTITITPRYFDETKVPMLAEILGVTDSLVYDRLKKARRWSAYQPSTLQRGVTFDVLSRLEENRYELAGVGFEIAQRRRYHTQAKAPHALGYVREISQRLLEQRREDGYRPGDLIGIAGLEKTFEEEMRGQVGSEFTLVNTYGRPIGSYNSGEDDIQPTSGYNLHLTIDSQVQALAESLFVNKRGAAVAIDPTTGGIIAFVNSPGFDPELFSERVSPETWDYLNNSEDKPMFNRATMSGMPPGSTWKPFMSLIALEDGIITENSTIHCPGAYWLGGRPFRDYGGNVHGNIAVRRSIQQSCNVFYFTLMMRMDVDRFKWWANQFGFGERVAIDIREQNPGLMPDSAYYNRVYGTGRWTAGYSINLGIGQGDMLVTPLQLARYIAAVANNGTLHVPYFVQELRHPETGDVIVPEREPARQIPIKPEHFQVVRDGMKLVMEAGTGRGVQLPDISSGGKTGTAQAPGGKKDHSLFVMFAPYENPQIALGVLVENGGYGATQAGPIASLMAEQYLTGKIADLPNRQALIQRLMRLQSEAL